MNQITSANDYIVIIKDGIGAADEWGQFNLNNKVLVVDIHDNKNEFENINKDKFNILVDRYVQNNHIGKTKIVSFSEIMIQENKSENRYYNLKKQLTLKNILRVADNYKFIGIILPILGLSILYFFYQLGYAFLYGFYFGGSDNNSIPIIDMVVNPVPFNFKSISAIGALLLLASSSYLFSLLLFIREERLKEKIFSFIIHIFIMLMFFFGIGVFLFGFDDKIFEKGSFLLLFLTIIPLMIIWVVCLFRASIEKPLLLMSGILYIGLLSVIIINMSKKENQSFILMICMFLGVMAINACIGFGKSIKDRFKLLANNRIIKWIVHMILYFPFSVTIFSIIYSKLKFEHGLIYTIIAAVIVSFFSSSNFKFKFEHTKSQKKDNDKSNKKRDNILLSATLACVMAITCLCSFFINATA
ncbi:hypothetical protein JHL18_02520 [Clostridium sp. YIM B02505]|uniref:DUF998 domain-containing protein n=1 Tax=Clostridium yunnanense TaxID=2800325 RepID=A0ABS1EJH9_9CLOT|nr:hypothetical protein [Clostridium yunnanense]MBK1809519.1 hypothetical protein [Clostridium yunnanense]